MAVAEAVPEYREYTNAERWIIVVALMLGSIMMIVDTSIVNVAIPTMMGTLGATLTQISWVSTGYIIAAVIMLPLTGWFSARFGRKRFLTYSIIIFTAASFLCGISHGLNELVFFRILQGIGGAALMSTAQATLMEIFPPQQLGMVQAIFGVGMMAGPAIGPTLGGWITTNYNWPWIFFINLPIGIAAAILTYLFIHDSHLQKRRDGGVDFFGIGLLAIGLGCLQTMLEKGNSEGWFDSNFICVLTFFALTGLTAFVFWELHTPHPAVNLRVLRHRSFTAGTLYASILGMGLFGGIFVLPVFLQNLRHYTAMQSGIMMLPAAIATAIIMPVVGKLTGRFSSRNLVAIGSIGFILSTLMLTTLTMDTGYSQLFLPLVLRGMAMALLFVPLTLATLVGLQGQEIADGTGLFNLARQLGGSIGIAVLTTFVDHRTTFHHAILSERISLYNPVALQRLQALQGFFMSKGAPLATARAQALTAIDGIVRGQAAVMAFIDVFILVSAIFIIAMPLIFFLRKGVPGGRPHVAAE